LPINIFNGRAHVVLPWLLGVWIFVCPAVSRLEPNAQGLAVAEQLQSEVVLMSKELLKICGGDIGGAELRHCGA
jgi:hypothetical protein